MAEIALGFILLNLIAVFVGGYFYDRYKVRTSRKNDG